MNFSFTEKPMNDRVKELAVAKDTDSMISAYSLLNETVCNEWNEPENTTISRNWIKIDKSKTDVVQCLNQQLANLNCQTLDELTKARRILEIDGQLFDHDTNADKLLSKLKRSTSIVQMVVLN